MKLFIEISLFIGFFWTFILGLFVYLKGKNKQANRYFFALMTSGSLWSLFLVLGIIFTNSFLDRICIVCGFFANNFFLLFSKAFSITKRISLSFSIFVSLIPLLIAPVILFSNLILGETIFHPEGFVESPDGPLVFIFYAFHIIYSFMAFYYLIKGYKSASGLRKIQFQYLFIGLGLFIFWFFFMNTFLPVIGIYHFISLSSLALIFLASFFLYIISRFRFMGIRFMIRKGAIYTLTVAIVFAIYTGLVFIVKEFFVGFTSGITLALNFTAIILIAIGFEPLRRLVRKSVDQWFFPETKELKSALDKIKAELSKTVDLQKFSQEIFNEISKIIPIKKTQFFVLNKREGVYHLTFPEEEKGAIQLRVDNILIKYILNNSELVVKEELPLISEGKSEVEKEELIKIEKEMNKYGWAVALPIGFERPNGILFLETKQNKEAYTLDDLNFLNTLKIEASSALDNAILYKEAVERIKVR